MKCNCTDWGVNMPKLEAQAEFCANQSSGPKWDGEPFTHCPWCGLPLLVSGFVPVFRTLADIEAMEKMTQPLSDASSARPLWQPVVYSAVSTGGKVDE